MFTEIRDALFERENLLLIRDSPLPDIMSRKIRALVEANKNAC